nr:DUF998 domain-containing protein [Candidatus Sigynarchaeota archaeon]
MVIILVQPRNPLAVRLGGMLALVAMGIGVSFIMVAMAFYPGFDIRIYSASQLGSIESPLPLLFDAGLILAGIIAVPFFQALFLALGRVSTAKKSLVWARFFSFAACAGLSLCGVFSMDIPTRIPHFIFAGIFFLGGLLFCVCFGKAMHDSKRLPRFLAWTSFAVAGFFALLFAIPTELVEWLVFFAIVSWVVENGLFLTIKGNSLDEERIKQNRVDLNR